MATKTNGPFSGDAQREAWRTRRRNLAICRAKAAFRQARVSEARSKQALRRWGRDHGWKVAFFEGKTGAPRTGIIDAIAYRLGRSDADQLDVRLIQLKGGGAGASGDEIGRLKKAVKNATVTCAVAAFDGRLLHLLDELVEQKAEDRRRRPIRS